MLYRLSASVCKTLPFFTREIGGVSVKTNSSWISGVLTMSMASAASSKPLRASFVPWMNFFRHHPAPKSIFPDSQQRDHRIFGVLAAVSLLALSKKADCDQDKDLDDLSHVVFQSFPALDKLKDKEPVLFIGSTGSGKSATLNHLMGISMKVVKVDTTGRATLISNESDAFRIEEGDDTPQSAIIKTRQEPTSGLWLTDCPSFSEGRRKTYRFASEISSSLATQTAEKVKALVVTIGVKELGESKGESFRKIALILHNLVVNAADAKQSIFFLFTKSPIEKGWWTYYVKPAQKSEIIGKLEEIQAQIGAKSQSDLTEEDLATRNIISLMLEQDEKGNGSKEKPTRTRPQGSRIFVIDITNSDQRHEILNAITQAPGIERNQFISNIRGDVAEALRHCLVKHMQIGLEIPVLLGLKKQKAYLDHRLKERCQNIQAMNDDIDKLMSGGKYDIKHHLEMMQREKFNIENQVTRNESEVAVLEKEIAKTHSKKEVIYWEETFFSEARFFDFYTREHTFEYNGQPFTERVIENCSRKNGALEFMVRLGLSTLESKIIPEPMQTGVKIVTSAIDVGEQPWIYEEKVNKPSEGKYKSRFDIQRWGAKGEFTVKIYGPHDLKEDVVEHRVLLEKKLKSTIGDLEQLKAAEARTEEIVNDLKAQLQSVNAKMKGQKIVDSLAASKQELESEQVSDYARLKKLVEKQSELALKIARNKSNLNHTLRLMQFVSMSNALLLDFDLRYKFEQSMEDLPKLDLEVKDV